MNRAQRVILAIYCILLAYCCIWIPWRVTFGSGQMTEVIYSLVWAAPKVGYERGFKAVPEMNLILLRIVGLTVISAVVFELANVLRKPATRS